MKNIVTRILVLFAGIVLFNGCGQIVDSDLQNPNLPGPATADVDLYLASVQSGFVGFYWNAYGPTSSLSRMEQWSGPNYNNGYSPQSFNGIWTTGYLTLNNAKAMIDLAITQKKYIHAGIGQVMSAYILGTMVDLFDSIPLTDALQGVNNLTPKASSGPAVYQYIDTLLGSAIVNFGLASSSLPTFDNFYAGSASNWIRAANTFRLKFYNQQRLVNGLAIAPKIQKLITDNNLINAPANDFNFKYSTTSTPNSRHPFYTTSYRGTTATSTTGSGTYLNNYYMFLVAVEKRAKARGFTSGGSWEQSTMTVPSTYDTFDDPRRRYMFYRPYTNYSTVNGTTITCSAGVPEPAWFTDPTMPFCLPAATGGYWGRDHGDNSGTPPDAPYRTAYGVYPGGGAFDNNAIGGTANTFVGQGGQGAGIAPIWNSEFTNFVIAELSLVGGQPALAKQYLLAGVRASINKMQGLSSTISYTLPTTDTLRLANTTLKINTYVNLVSRLWDNAANDDERLDVIIKEYFIALWGNGIEAYNNLRRTGKPSNIQLPVYQAPGPDNLFMRSLTYPSVYIQRNSNAAAQKENPGLQTYRVWWDINTGTNNVQ